MHIYIYMHKGICYVCVCVCVCVCVGGGGGGGGGGLSMVSAFKMCTLEADIFSVIAMNHLIETGQEKMSAGGGGTGNSNDTQLYTQTYLLYK